MRNSNFLLRAGILLYVLLSVLDRFIYKLPDIVFIPVALIGIACIITGMIKRKKDKE